MTDWDRLKAEFLGNAISIRELGDKHGIPAGTILCAAQRGKWTEERDRLNASAFSAAVGDRKTDLAQKMIDLSDRELSAAEVIRAKALTMLDEARTPADVKAIAATVESCQKTARTALNMPSIPVRQTSYANKTPREMTNSELLDSLCADPHLRSMMTLQGIDPSTMDDDALLVWVTNHYDGRV